MPPKPRQGKSWTRIAREAWATDILRERSYVWLLVSRLLFLIAGSLLVNFVVIYLGRAFGMTKEEANAMYVAILIVVVAANVVAILPASRLSDRVGRKPLIFAACAGGAAGAAIIALTPSIPARPGRGGAVRRRERQLPGRRLGADDRHHPEGVGRPVHGHEQRRDGFGHAHSSIAIGGLVLDLVARAATRR